MFPGVTKAFLVLPGTVVTVNVNHRVGDLHCCQKLCCLWKRCHQQVITIAQMHLNVSQLVYYMTQLCCLAWFASPPQLLMLPKSLLMKIWSPLSALVMVRQCWRLRYHISRVFYVCLFVICTGYQTQTMKFLPYAALHAQFHTDNKVLQLISIWMHRVHLFLLHLVVIGGRDNLQSYVFQGMRTKCTWSLMHLRLCTTFCNCRHYRGYTPLSSAFFTSTLPQSDEQSIYTLSRTFGRVVLWMRMKVSEVHVIYHDHSKHISVMYHRVASRSVHPPPFFWKPPGSYLRLPTPVPVVWSTMILFNSTWPTDYF